MGDRPRGYAAWNPKPASIEIVDQVREVLREYRDYLPMTARQIFYRMVGAHDYAKTEQAYDNLCSKLVLARRAGMIPFDAIRDDKVTEHGAGGGYRTPEIFWRGVRNSGEYYHRPTREDQEAHVEFWTEAGGMSGMVAESVFEYGVPVFSAGGFLSVTATHQIAKRALRRDIPTIMLHVGDYDPSGESIFDAMMEDARAFYVADGGASVDFEAIRVALTWEQVEEHNLDTAPPKKSDGRSAKWEEEGRTETAQLEAMPPDLLTRLCREAVEEHTDLVLLEEIRDVGDTERDEIIETLEGLIDRKDD